MADRNDIHVDAWGKKGEAVESLPGDVVLLCTYGLNVGIDTIEEAAFIRRTETVDELWVASEVNPALLDAVASGEASAADIKSTDSLSPPRCPL